MSLPTLPAEIHELIIEFVAQNPYRKSQKALSTCSLVCTSWHSFALRHTFQEIEFPHNVRRASDNILRLMEANRDISRCVKSIIIFTTGGLREDPGPAYTNDEFEQVCRLVSTSIVRLEIVGTAPSPASHPLPGLSLLLKSPNLRHLKFSQAFLSTSFLEAAPHLETLSFEHVGHLILDHKDGSKLARFNKLELMPYAVQPVIESTHHSPDLYRLFASTRHLAVTTYPLEMQTTTLGDLGSLHWASCTVFDLDFEGLSCEYYHIHAFYHKDVTKAYSFCYSAQQRLFFLFPACPLVVTKRSEDFESGAFVYPKTSIGSMGSTG